VKNFYSRCVAAFLLAALLFGLSPASQAYSVLTHEAIIDSAWDTAIQPLLLARFPGSSPEQLKEAHSYAYGGAIIADAGYYPFGNKFFSDLIHYVRTADFVKALLRDSQNLDEYAFAIGALAHYAGDNNGHRIAVNKSVPILYPHLEHKFGDTIVYDEDPAAHLKTEFGFDVVQVAKGHYAPDNYRDYIGFNVSKRLLEQAFQETYGIELKSIFTDYDLALGTFRRSVSSVIPEMTKVAWKLKQDDIRRDYHDMTKKRFIYNISRADYNRTWPKTYREPGFGAKLLAFFFRLVPKVGPLRTLSFRTPTPQVEQLFMKSFNVTLDDYKRLLHEQREQNQIEITDDNLDTGGVTGPGQYPLADKTYAELLDRLSKKRFASASPELRQVLLSYYGDLNAPFSTKKHKKQWAAVVKQVQELKTTSKPESAFQPLSHYAVAGR
jgi:hypothetical protein